MDAYLTTGVWQAKNISLAKVSMDREQYNVENSWNPSKELLNVQWIWCLKHLRKCSHGVSDSFSRITPSFLKTPLFESVQELKPLITM